MKKIIKGIAAVAIGASLSCLTGCDTVNRVVDAVQEALTTTVITVAQEPVESTPKETAATTTTTTTETATESVPSESGLNTETGNLTTTGIPNPTGLIVGDFTISGKYQDKPFRAFELTYVFEDFDIIESVGVFEDGGFATGEVPIVRLKNLFTEEQFLLFCDSVPGYKEVELSPRLTEGEYYMYGASANLYESIITNTENPDAARQFALTLADAYKIQQSITDGSFSGLQIPAVSQIGA